MRILAERCLTQGVDFTDVEQSVDSTVFSLKLKGGYNFSIATIASIVNTWSAHGIVIHDSGRSVVTKGHFYGVLVISCFMYKHQPVTQTQAKTHEDRPAFFFNKCQ